MTPDRTHLAPDLEISRVVTGLWQVADQEKDGVTLDLSQAAGSLEGYAYSGALRASGIRWDRASLDRWLAGPSAMVPGTRMPFRGISDPVARRQVVDYLMTLR